MWKYENICKSTEYKKELKKLRKNATHKLKAKILVRTSYAKCSLSICWDLHSAIFYSAFDNVCCLILFGAHFMYRLLLIHMSKVTFEKFLFGFLTTFLVPFLGWWGGGVKVFLSTALSKNSHWGIHCIHQWFSTGVPQQQSAPTNLKIS